MSDVAQALTIQQVKLSVPRGMQTQSVILSAVDRLALDDSSVVGKTGGTIRVVNFGASGSEVGANAKVNGNLDSVSMVTLRSASTIFGKLRTAAASVTKQGGTRVLGGEQTGATLPADVVTWNVTFPSTDSGDVMILNQAGKNDRALAPGSYKSITAQPGTTLRLRSGTYYASAIDLESNAKLILDTSAGPIFVYVSGALIYRVGASMSVPNGPVGNVLFGAFGSSEVFLEAPFLGTVVAPNAKVTLKPSAGGAHKGQFFGKSVEVASNTTVELSAFDWSYTSVDSDCDGMSDMAELSAGLNPNSPTDAKSDLDHDGISAIEELTLGGNPNASDSDGNGRADNPDLFAQTDFDGDGRVYASDNCPNMVNPSQEDADHDGKGDVCDSTPTGGEETALRSLALYRAPSGDAALAPQGFFDSRRIKTDLNGLYQTDVNVYAFSLPLGTMTQVTEMWHASGAHAYATSDAEKNTLLASGYQELGPLGYFSPTPLAFGKSVQLRRFAKTISGHVSHAFAVSAAGATALVAEGFAEIAALGYGLQDDGKLKHSSLVVRYRDAAGHYRYRESALGEPNFAGWSSDGNKFRIFERPSAYTVPLYRMVNSAGYEAIVLLAEIATYKSQGYASKGILGHAYPAAGAVQTLETMQNLIRVTGTSKEPAYTTSSDEAQQLIATGGYSASVVIARVVALTGRDNFRQGKTCAGTQSIDDRVTQAVAGSDPRKTADGILLALGSACMLERISSGAALSPAEQAAKEFLATLDPQAIKVATTAAKALGTLSAATRAALLGPLAGLDPMPCDKPVDVERIMTAASAETGTGTATVGPDHLSLVKLRAPQCQGTTYAPGDRAVPGEAAKAVTAVALGKIPDPVCNELGCTPGVRDVYGRIDPIVYGVKSGGYALPKSGATEKWREAHAGVGDPLVGTTVGDCSSCSAALGQSCVTSAKGTKECRSYPVVQNATTIRVSGANFWDLSTARARFTQVSTGQRTEVSLGGMVAMHAYNDWADGTHRVEQCNYAPVPQASNIGSPDPDGLPVDLPCVVPPGGGICPAPIHYNRDVLATEKYIESIDVLVDVPVVGDFYTLEIINANGSYIPRWESVPVDPKDVAGAGRTVHVCLPPNCDPMPSVTEAACSLGSIPNCGGSVGGIWNTPPRSLSECTNLFKTQSVLCPETPLQFVSPTTADDGTPLRIYVASADPSYIQTRLHKVQCRDETGTDAFGDDELVVSYTGVALEDLAVGDQNINLTDVYKTDINSGDNIFPNTKFTRKRSNLLDIEPVRYLIQVGEDDDIGFAMIAAGGLGALLGGLGQVANGGWATAAGAVGGGIAGFVLAYNSADKPAYDPDDFIGQSGWETTSDDVATRGMLAHLTPLDAVPVMSITGVDRELVSREAGVHPAVDGIAYDNNSDVIACGSNANCNAQRPVCFLGACVQSLWQDASRPIPFNATSDIPGVIEHLHMNGEGTEYHFWISTSVTSTP